MPDEKRPRVVVVGSGFGGAVTACRLAQAGAEVTVLERGRRWGLGAHPFPRKFGDPWAWDPHRGPFEVHLHGDVRLVLVAGVGGGSLLYSNVHLRMPADGFDGWPDGWTREELDPYYALVETMLDVRPIDRRQPCGVPKRTDRLEEAAKYLERSDQYFRPPLAVNFGPAGEPARNRYGMCQEGCRHCGKCSVGCNYGAKNSLDKNYLPLAVRRGARIRADREVTGLSVVDDVYQVTSCNRVTGETEVDHADYLVLAAGALGTTSLLRTHGRRLGASSPRIGDRYSANGDAVRIATGTTWPWEPTRGPAITAGILCVEGAAADAPWFLVEDGGIPPLLSRDDVFRPSEDPGRRHFAPDEDLVKPDADDGLAPPEEEPDELPLLGLDHVAILLAMGRDSADGQIGWREDGHPDVEWPDPGPLLPTEEGVMDALATSLGGQQRGPDGVRVSVHSLGGAVMGDGPETGVVGSDGLVFGTKAVYVVDGAALPSATGVNPSHTIAAVAERNAERLARKITGDPRWQAPERNPTNGVPDPLPPAPAGGSAPLPSGDGPGHPRRRPVPDDPSRRPDPDPDTGVDPDPNPPRRSLLLAGGGLKVAFQAGVLQVLLSEAKLNFAHYDACSGGAFNLAMLCEGRTGLEVADAWRDTRPGEGASFSLLGLLRGRSLLTLDAYRYKVFRRWGLDWDRIRRSALDATFTAWDVTHQRRHEFRPAEMTEDALVACLSQPLWFPPVMVDGTLYTDAVFDTDANVQSAIDRKVREIWVIWTVSRRSQWLPGPIAQFFHALEQAANGSLDSELARIEWNNAEVKAGRWGLVGHCITIRKIEAEVPAHYLVLLGQDRLHRLVELGVRAGRKWCADNGYSRPVIVDRDRYYDDGVRLDFPDHLRGDLGGRPAALDLTLTIEDAGEFTATGLQRARMTGWVTSPLLLEGRAEVTDGYADILVDGGDTTRKRMHYVLPLRDRDGRPVTLIGTKRIESGQLRWLWAETTRMSLRLVDRPVDRADPEKAGATRARGLVRMRPRDVALQVLTVKGSSPDPTANLRAKARFGTMFVGHLWDAYARKLLSYAPF